MGKVLAIVGLLVVMVIAFVGMALVGFHNTETDLRVAYEAKIDANKADFDNTWKTISQVAQVPSKYKDDFQGVFTSYMEARKGGNTGKGELLSFLSEAVPQYDAQALYLKVQTVVEAKRESWTSRQKELRDIKREHDKLIRQVPGAVYNAFLGRDALEVILVTSDKTEEAFTTGADNDVSLFE